MQRRIELAKGLLHHPGVLLLDEPTTGLDLARAAACGNTCKYSVMKSAFRFWSQPTSWKRPSAATGWPS